MTNHASFPAEHLNKLCLMPQILTAGANTGVEGVVDSPFAVSEKVRYTVSCYPLNGSFSLDTQTGKWTYTPNYNFTGVDVVILDITSENNVTCRSTIVIQTDSPIENPEMERLLILGEGGTMNGLVTENLQLTGSLIGFTVLEPPANGQLALHPFNGSWTYTPVPTFSGTDSFAISAAFSGGTTQSFRYIATVTPKKQDDLDTGASYDIQLSTTASTDTVFVETVFSYIVKVTNSGTAALPCVNLTCSLPPQLSVLNLELDGTPIAGSLEKGVAVWDLVPGQTRTLLVSIKGVAPLSATPCPITVSGQFERVDLATREMVSVTKTFVDQRGITVIAPALTLVLSVSKETTVVGEPVMYSLGIKNDGNVRLNRIVILCSLSFALQFQPGSVAVEGLKREEASIIRGVEIDSLSAGAMKILTFQANILQQEKNNSLCKVTASFEYTDETTGEVYFGTVASNECSIRVRRPHLHIRKSADRDIAMLEDILVYTVELINDGDMDVVDVIFFDELPASLKPVDGSFFINDRLVRSVNYLDGVNIGGIPAGGTSTVQYSATVVAAAPNHQIRNKAGASYGYSLEASQAPLRVYAEEGVHEVPLALALFKQVNVKNLLTLPDQNPVMLAINDMTGTVQIKECYSIQSIQSVSCEGQHSTGMKLILHSNLNLVVDYTAERSEHSAVFHLPFSTFIVMPENFNPHLSPDIKVVVQDIYYKQLSEKEFYSFVNLLIIVHDHNL